MIAAGRNWCSWFWLFAALITLSGCVTRSVDVDGFEGEEASFSPDGSQLLFRRAVDGKMAIMTVDLASGKERVIFDGLGSAAFPSWTPDGAIIYASYPSSANAFTMKQSDVGWNVYRVRDGKAEQLTRGRERHKTPHLAADGTLYYTSDAIRPASKKAALPLDSCGIMMQKDGKASVLIQPQSDHSLMTGFKVSPDGQRFVMTEVRHYGDCWHVVCGSFAKPARRELLTDNTMIAYAPCWRADGKLIAFTGCREGDDGWYVYVMEPTPGSPMKRIGRGKNPSFSPDGRRIVCDLDNRLRFYELGEEVRK